MNIRKYDTDGLGYIRAEIEWKPETESGSTDSKDYAIPSSGIAILSVSQEEFLVTVVVTPDDLPFSDILQLPIKPGDTFPLRLIGASIPSVHFELPFLLAPLDDTRYGFALSVGLKS